MIYPSNPQISVAIKQQQGCVRRVRLEFTSNGGKHGCDELLDTYVLTPKELLEILQLREDIYCECDTELHQEEQKRADGKWHCSKCGGEY